MQKEMSPHNDPSVKNDNALCWLWLLVAAVPLLTLLFSFIFLEWGWGLMDDMTILSHGSTIVGRFLDYFSALIPWGVFRPTYAAHAAVFYTVFEKNPQAFYIFRLFEVGIVLLIWGVGAARMTQRVFVLPMLAAITLSFHYFYDSIFYLSSQELIGLFFLGLSFNFYYSHIREIFEEDEGRKKTSIKNSRWSHWVWGTLCLFCAYGAKEPFIASGLSFGLAYLIVAIYAKNGAVKRNLFTVGITIFALTLIYAFLMLFFIRSFYTASYTFNNLEKIQSNLIGWFKKDFLNHLPWLAAIGFILWNEYKRRKVPTGQNHFPLRRIWALSLGVFLYVSYLMILLPWNAQTYYAAPLGLYFSLLTIALISNAFLNISWRHQLAIIFCALIINQVVCQYALARESTYQYDTRNLMEWFKVHEALGHDPKTTMIACNAMEASIAIPRQIQWRWGVDYNDFISSLYPENLLNGKHYDYYIYSPRFQAIHGQSAKNWQIVFLSKNWVMYKRNDRP